MISYNSIVTAIPSKWKEILKQKVPLEKTEFEDKGTEIRLKVGNRFKAITKLINKEIYQYLISLKYESPKAIDTWVNLYPFLDRFDWKTIFKLSFENTVEPYLQSFQYKIINMILNTREKLNKWRIIDSNKCLYCKEIDTLEHHLYSCFYSKLIWKQVESWIKSQLEIKFTLTECEILFGIPLNNSVELKIINFVILITKWYINNCKCMGKELFFIEVNELFREKIDCVVYHCKIHNTEPAEWQNKLLL